MKKAVTMLAAVVAGLSLVAGTASASGGPVLLASEFACGVLDGQGNVIVTYNSTLTLYENQKGAKLVMRCSGWGTPARSLTYFNYGNTGLGCSVFVGTTYDWSDKVGRNGNSQLTCTLNLTDEDVAIDAASGGTAGLG